MVQKLDLTRSKIWTDVVQNLHPNNNNINNTNITTTNGKKSAAAIAVNFKKLKKKGEERIREIKNTLRSEAFTFNML
jgi:hypothetical protein